MYKTLIEVLKELPNVAPNNAKKQIKLAFIEGEEAIKQNFKICDCTFTKEEIDLFYKMTTKVKAILRQEKKKEER